MISTCFPPFLQRNDECNCKCIKRMFSHSTLCRPILSKFSNTFFYLSNNINIPVYVMDLKSHYGIGILEN